mgnify:CR=1 FL=1
MDAVKEKKGTMDLTEGSSFKKIIVFSIPLIIGNIFQLFYSWADAIVIGKTDGAVAYGSITASMPVIFLILTVTNGFLTGAVVILSQLFSKKDEVGIKKSLNTILITMLVASLLVTVIGYFGTKPLLKLLKVSPEQIEGTTAYLQIYFLGSIAVVMYNTFNMGIGMVLCLDGAEEEKALETLRSLNEEPVRLGEVVRGRGVIL